ncbi:glycosyl hydrolase 1 family [Rhizoctonia solani]|uniref:Glycosyl hydrolase 1 family n=1 Tax=Rhizoctonia solani TaxID=456999 RepID=A0A8H7LY74_9AGAM|nr:glycosyl hydrolase 1 family [Rhizoctonia solani]
MPLPSNFLYGYATAAYQIEGGRTDGKGDSIWDTFVHKEGKITNGETGERCCPFEAVWRHNLSLFDLLVRVIPLGGRNDPVNEAGIKYYNSLIDELIKEGLHPWLLYLYHWDLPQALEDKYEGWLNKEEISLDFERYARVCFERFGDRVKHWITLNEPWCAASWGYATGWMAPGRTSDRKKNPTGDTKTEPWIVGHSLLIAHAKAVKLYREEFKSSQNGQIGITLNCDWAEPYDESPEAKDAASRRLDMNWDGSLVLSHEVTPDASLTDKPIADQLPDSSTMEIFACVPDTQVGRDGKLIGRQGEAPWLVSCPWGFRKLLRYINEKYIRDSGLVIMITEQGYPVWREYELPLDKIIDDKDRQEYFDGYLTEVLGAVEQDGIKIGSYVAWTLIDNFEWAAGFNQRFGSAYIDHKDGHKRIPKDSGRWLGEWFKKNVAK